MLKFFPNIDLFCKKNKHYDKNDFAFMEPNSLSLPKYDDINYADYVN